MPIKSIQNISCSLNLGMIYNLDYSWTKEEGVRIVVYFVNESGIYPNPPLSPKNKQTITIGGTTFSVYAKSYKRSLSSGRRVISVEFVDEFFKLDNYYVVLTGRGCGQNVYPLGSPVDKRTNQQKIQDALDPQAQQIIQLTKFPDVEYSFGDFLAVLSQKFTVSVSAYYDNTITRGDFTGTFREVLDSWCNFFNISYFFENGTIKIFDPSTLTINFPPAPIDAITVEEEEDIGDTYGKTVFNWFQQEGGEKPLNDVDSNSQDTNNSLTRSLNLYPVGYEANSEQIPVDINQATAAQYGAPFWFLYNFYKGTEAAECGFINYPTNSAAYINSNISDSIEAVLPKAGNISLGRVAEIDTTLFQEKFELYSQYGREVAGRYYLSNILTNAVSYETYQWYDSTNVQIANFNSEFAEKRKISPRIILSDEDTENYVEGTEINALYPGVKYRGDRMYLVDTEERDDEFVLSDELTQTINALFEQITLGADVSSSIDFSRLGDGRYFAYVNPLLGGSGFPQELINLINGIQEKAKVLQPKYKSMFVVGVDKSNYINTLNLKEESPDIEIVQASAGPGVISNTAVIKTVRNGTYSLYYDKYSDCASASTPDNYFKYIFDGRQISEDIGIIFTFNKSSRNTYTLNRDYNALRQIINNPYLQSLAQPRTFPTRTFSYTVNYFLSVPAQFLSNGLVGLQVSFTDNGVVSTYSYSNSVLETPNYARQANAWEERIRNSWINKYQPKETII